MPIDDDIEGLRIVGADAGGSLIVADEVLAQVESDAAFAAAISRAGATAAVFDGAGTEAVRPGWRRVRLANRSLTDAARRVHAAVRVLERTGTRAQPNHVFTADNCGDGCGPHPADAIAAGFGADPFKANPFKANPFKANPFKANQVVTPFKANEGPRNTAIPAAARVLPEVVLQGHREPRILVLDTGLADDGVRPALVRNPRIDGDETDLPDMPITDGSGTLLGPADQILDPVAGHGTFIAGVIEQLAPGCHITIREVVSRIGFVVESDVVARIDQAAGLVDPPDIINLSFSGPTPTIPQALADAIADAHLAGVVIVASAGNSGTCVPHYPAAFPEVIAVGAVGAQGPAPWTNYGGWVDACAPGIDLVSSFFIFNGAVTMVNGVDVDAFGGWAMWSGTSFSAPVVVASLARRMMLGDVPADKAVAEVIGADHLARLPCLGTVVNC